MKYSCFLVLCFSIFVLSGTLFAEQTSSQKQLKDTIESYLAKGDSVQVCQLYKQLNREIDSIAQINYQKKITSFRDIYQIDQLYLQNRLQKRQIWQRSMLYCGIFIALLVGVILYLRFGGKRLEHSRAIAQEMKQQAEHSMESKRRLLSNVSREMHDLLSDINNKLEALRLGNLNGQDKNEFFEAFKAKTDALQSLYETVCRKESEKR